MKITVYRGGFDKTCTVSSNLTQNQQKMPIIRDIVQYAEPRMLSTMIVSGATKPWDLVGDRTKTKIGVVPSGKLIGDNAYRYNIQGRIQQKSVINAVVGTPGADGTFQLSLRDNYIVPGMVVTFHNPQMQARVMGLPSGSGTNYIYTFQSVDRTVFVAATHINGQVGEKTCFGGFTAYGERSLRGYGRSHYPDQFINHLTIQRKTIALSGDALTDVLWYSFNGTKGWKYMKERQSNLQFMMEDEHHKWFSRSTMRDANGVLLAQSNLIDPETGEQIIIGDGIIEQIRGGNEMDGSGLDGFATLDDFRDMMGQLEKKSNAVYNKRWYVVTGTDGYGNAQEVLRDYWILNLGGVSNHNGGNSGVGGDEISVGSDFNTLNINGNQLVFCKHTLFDDEERWGQRGNDGKLIQSGMYVILDAGMVDGTSNMEILAKGAFGINRSMVTKYINGLTGAEGDTVSSVDALEYNMLKQNGIFIYNTQSCGIIHKSVM